MDQVSFPAWLMGAANAFKTEEAAWAVLLFNKHGLCLLAPFLSPPVTSSVCFQVALLLPHSQRAKRIAATGVYRAVRLH